MSSHNLFEAQMFLDDALLAESVRLGRVWHTPRKRHKPVLTGGTPWEGDLICAYGSVLFYDGKFNIWYVAFNKPHVLVCYAESPDGIHWTKPDLGLYEHDGSRDNNILFAMPDSEFVDCLGVIDDPQDRTWPLKMIYYRGGNSQKSGLYAARSCDGIHWDLSLGRVLPGWSDRTNVMPSRDHGRFVIFGRCEEHLTPLLGRDHTWCRVVSRTESPDLLHWSKPEVVIASDRDDSPYLQIYSATVFKYESLYLGLIERMHMVPDVLDPEITFSRDGYRWQRSRLREAFIPRGAEDSWDSGWISGTSNAPIACNGELLIHYSGRAHGHSYPPSYRMGAIGVVSLRIDGFCSLQATECEGWLVTPPLSWPAAELALNVDTRRHDNAYPRFCNGEVAVEVRTSEGKPVEGFTFADNVPLRNNTDRENKSAETVKWKSNRRLASLCGRSLRLAFRLRDAHLYSFRARKTDDEECVPT